MVSLSGAEAASPSVSLLLGKSQRSCPVLKWRDVDVGDSQPIKQHPYQVHPDTLRHTDIKGHDHCYRALWQFGCAVKKGIKNTTDSLLLENKLFIDVENIQEILKYEVKKYTQYLSVNLKMTERKHTYCTCNRRCCLIADYYFYQKSVLTSILDLTLNKDADFKAGTLLHKLKHIVSKLHSMFPTKTEQKQKVTT